ncbi:hypothetical protein HK101_001740, partial [Irineochytrium annulatum]
MPKFVLSVKADLENVTNLRPKDEDYDWSFKIKCSKCNEVDDGFVVFNAVEEEEIPNSRGTANLIMKCKFCSNAGNA